MSVKNSDLGLGDDKFQGVRLCLEKLMQREYILGNYSAATELAFVLLITS